MNYYDKTVLKESKKYGTYLEIKTNKDIFRNIKTQKELQKAAYDYLLNGNNNFKKIVDLINGKRIVFIRLSAKEYVYGDNSRKLSQNDIQNKGFYRDKMRLSSSIDDLINYSTIQYHSPYLSHGSKKGNLFSQNGFNNFQGQVCIDSMIFSYIVRIGILNTKESAFYDAALDYKGIIKGTKQKVPRTNSTSLIKGLVPSSSNISNENTNVKSYLDVDNNEEQLEIRDAFEIYYCFSMC